MARKNRDKHEQEQQQQAGPDEATDAGLEQAADAAENAEAPEAEDAGEHSQLDQLQQERDELFARLQRVSADYQNYMRRSAQNLEDSIELARGDLAKQFITVLDHFDNALSNEPESDEAKALYEGVRIVRDELLRVLQNMGVERIDVEPGEPFDPNIHEAMLRQEAADVQPNHVSALYQPGYRYKSRTLRPAKVAVAPEA